MNTSTIPVSAQMVIDITDYAVVKDLKRLLARVDGVGKICVKKDYYGSKEFYQDLDEAETEIAQGKGVRIDSQESLDALFA